MKELFKKIILERQEWFNSVDLVERDVSIEEFANYAFTGLRRAGKSYMLYQIIKQVSQKHGLEEILFINFEDERLLEVSSDDLQYITEAYYELFSHKPILFLDEIQNVSNWQKFVRRLTDSNYRVYITGSNAQMLSHEIASTLGGRFINKEILPLSFPEYLKFCGISFTQNFKYKNERFQIIRAYEDFLVFGGFPELVKFKNKREFLSSVYQKLFYGDIIARYKISNATMLKLILKKLAESVNNETSVNRIKNIIKSIGLKVGSNTVYDYLSYLEHSFMIGSVQNYFQKISEKESNKKYYFMDTGLLSLFLVDQDTKLLENQIYIQLRRKGYKLFFLKKLTEVDFYVPEQELLIQVSYDISKPDTFKRETKALEKAMKYFDINQSWIITKNQSNIIEVNSGKINVVPAWQWLLE
jgi:predicted AAA+ superfamily ATPase